MISRVPRENRTSTIQRKSENTPPSKVYLEKLAGIKPDVFAAGNREYAGRTAKVFRKIKSEVRSPLRSVKYNQKLKTRIEKMQKNVKNDGGDSEGLWIKFKIFKFSTFYPTTSQEYPTRGFCEKKEKCPLNQPSQILIHFCF